MWSIFLNLSVKLIKNATSPAHHTGAQFEPVQKYPAQTKLLSKLMWDH